MQWISMKMQQCLPPIGAFGRTAPKHIPIPLSFYDALIDWRWYVYEASAVVAGQEEWQLLSQVPLEAINDACSSIVSDVILFAYVEGFAKEAGSVSLRELQRSFTPYGSMRVREYEPPLMLADLWPYGD